MAGIEEPAPLSRKRRHPRIPLVGQTLQLYDRRQGRLRLLLRIAKLVYQQTTADTAKAKIPHIPATAWPTDLIMV